MYECKKSSLKTIKNKTFLLCKRKTTFNLCTVSIEKNYDKCKVIINRMGVRSGSMEAK